MRNLFLKLISIKFFKILILSVLCILIWTCKKENQDLNPGYKQYIKVLGIIQDGGFPHIDNPEEWSALEKGKVRRERVVSLGLVDLQHNQKWLFEATPDMPEQLFDLKTDINNDNTIIDGVFLTHAHIGHYTGLMHFGREAMGADKIPVYAMPRMTRYLKENGPWSQLVSLDNIELKTLIKDSTVHLNKNLKVIPFLVPHRDEFSETVGYKILGPNKSALFIPDINKWELWDRSIVDEVRKVDYAFLDATFFKEGEIPRPMSEVPHPFIVETVALFENESKDIRSKIIFVHFNHSNPAILEHHKLKDSIGELGFRFARQGDIFNL